MAKAEPMEDQMAFTLDDSNPKNLEIYDINLQHWVAKANPLVEARYKLSSMEQKILMVLASKVQPTDETLKPYKFRVLDFADIIGAKKGTGIYTYFREVVTGLQRKTLSFKNGTKYVVANWLMTSIYEDNEGTVILKFNPDLKNFYLHLKEQYTMYQLQNIVRLKSSYSIRIYELLKQYEPIKKRTFFVDEFRELVGIEKDVYPQYGHFKSRVLTPSQKELAEKTDIEFSFEEIKKGKKVDRILFHIKSKKVDHPDIVPDSLGEGTPSNKKPYLNEEEKTKDDIRQELLTFGIKPKAVEQLFKQVSLEQIQRNMEYTRNYQYEITNKTKFVVNAIKQDYANTPFPEIPKGKKQTKPVRTEIVPEHMDKKDDDQDILNGNDLEKKQELYLQKESELFNLLNRVFEIEIKLGNSDKLSEQQIKAKAMPKLIKQIESDYALRMEIGLKPRLIKDFPNSYMKDVYREFKKSLKS